MENENFLPKLIWEEPHLPPCTHSWEWTCLQCVILSVQSLL